MKVQLKEDLDFDVVNYKGTEDEVKAAKSLYDAQDAVRLAEIYLEENVPSDVRKTNLYQTMWVVVGKKIQLTFMEPDDRLDFDSMFQQAKILYGMQRPVYTYGFDDMIMMKQLEIHFSAAIRSAIGSKDGKVNERTMQNTQITQLVRSNTERFGGMQSSGGFIKRTLGKMI